MIVEIPVSFDYRGQHYSGHFVTGPSAGSVEATQFNLMIGGYFKGRLRFNRFDGEWYWDSLKGEGMFEEMKDYFVAVVVAWYE